MIRRFRQLTEPRCQGVERRSPKRLLFMHTRMLALVCCAASYYRPALRAASTQQALRMPRLAAAAAQY